MTRDDAESFWEDYRRDVKAQRKQRDMEPLNEELNRQHKAAELHEYGLKVGLDFHIIHSEPVLSLLGLKKLMANEKYLEHLRQLARDMGYHEDTIIDATNNYIEKREDRLIKKYKELNDKEDADLDI